MNPVISTLIAGLNDIGRGFCAHAAGVFVQSGMLILVLLIADLLIRKRVRATLRYWIWMLAFIKLLLPPTFSLPTGIGYWSGDYVSLPQAVGDEAPGAWGEGTVSRPPALAPGPESPTTQPSDPALAGITEPVQSVPIHSEPLAWQAVVFLCWGVGVLVFLALVIQRLFFVRRMIAQAGPAQGDLLDLLDQCRRQVGVRGQIEMRLSQDAFSPAVCGLWRPTILLPAAIVTELAPDKLRTVLIHELAHVKRADLWVNCLQTVLQVIYFYNPLVWLANAIVRRVREQAVDEMVLVALGAEARSYSNTLIDIAEMAFLRASPALRLIGVAESKKSLEGRIRHMVTRPIPTSARVGVIGLFVIVAMGAVVLPMAAAKTKPTQPRFTANLSHGVTVELVGICNWQTQEPTCWKPDGSPLDRPLRVTKWKTRPGVHHYGFMLRIAGPNDLDRSWGRIEGSDDWEAGCDVVDAQGNRLDGHTAAVALLKEGATQTALQLGFATGSWSTISTHDGKGMSPGGRTDVLWSQVFEDPRGTFVVATAEWRRERTRRIVAVDTEGLTHTGQGGSVATGNMDQMTTYFPGLRPAQIKELQYQVRAFEWARFEGISLQPGRKTTVKINANAPQDQAQRPEADDSAYQDEAAVRVQSAEALSRLGRSLLIYANDYDDRFPNSLDDLPSHIPDADRKWFKDSVEYLGKGKSVSGRPDEVVAFDRTLLEKGKGTNVLYLDSHIAFESPQRLERLGISAVNPEAARRAATMSHLKRLALAAIMYADDHQGSLASEVAELRPYLGNEGQFTWIIANVEYLGKGIKLNEVASAAAKPLAYWKTPTTDGTAVAFLDGHVEFVQKDRLPGLGITVRFAGVAQNSGQEGALRVYEVNRSVADFAPAEDFSTPEAAYATINRIPRGDPSAWQRVSVARVVDRLGPESRDRKASADPEWTKVLLNARIREVMIWNMTWAAVMAELPQGLSSRKVAEPIDVRYLQLENGRWLNTGNSRFRSLEEAKTQFMDQIERKRSFHEAMKDPLRHAGEIKEAAAQLFERLRTADYADILSYYRDGKWDPEGLRKFPTDGLYQVYTDYPSFALWCCTHFKDNPIVDVRLGEVFVGDALVVDKTGWPTVPYKLTLKDGTTLAGNLPFNYDINQGRGHWQGMEGLDWHLWSSETR